MICGEVRSRDGGDQGAINTLIWDRRVFGDRVSLLPQRYNAPSRAFDLRREAWDVWQPVAAHFTGAKKPWHGVGDADGRHARRTPEDLGALGREWRAVCGRPALQKLAKCRRDAKADPEIQEIYATMTSLEQENVQLKNENERLSAVNQQLVNRNKFLNTQLTECSRDAMVE